MNRQAGSQSGLLGERKGVEIMAKMRSEKVSEARRQANDKYDAKTYRKISFALRAQDDADIIRDIEAAKAEGLSLREWLRRLYDMKG